MSIGANIVVGFIALLHIYILVLEMFLWDKPAGLRAFGKTKEEAMYQPWREWNEYPSIMLGLSKFESRMDIPFISVVNELFSDNPLAAEC